MATPRPTRAQRAPADEIKDLYLNATPRSVARDLARAIDQLKGMASEEERERVAVYMDGLSQMRSEWAVAARAASAPPPAARKRR